MIFNKCLILNIIFIFATVGIIVCATTYPMLTKLGYLPSFEDPEILAQATDDIKSSVYRSAANYQLFNKFLDNPFVGIGLSQVLNIRTGGYISHTYFLLPLAAYGIIGFIPYLFFFYYYYRENYNCALELKTLYIFFILTSYFINDLWGWFGMLMALTPTFNTNSNQFKND